MYSLLLDTFVIITCMMMSSRDRKNVNNSIRNLDLTSVRCCSRGSNLEDDICGGQEENWSLLVQQDVTDGLIMTDCRRAIQVLVFKYFVKEFDLDPRMTSQPPNHPDHFSHPTLLHVPLGDWIVLEGLEWIGRFWAQDWNELWPNVCSLWPPRTTTRNYKAKPSFTKAQNNRFSFPFSNE